MVDPRRVQFRLKEPWPDFITFYGTTATSAGWIVPKKYVEKVGEDGFKKAPIGAGPYRVVSVVPGIEITLEAFEGYWRKVPRVKRLVFRSLPDETTRGAALKRGDVDIAYFLNGPIAEEVRRTPGLRLMAVRSNAIFFLDFRDQWEAASPWRDPRVRRAASLAIDRPTLNAAEQLGYRGAHRQCRAARAWSSRCPSTPTRTIRRGPGGCSPRPATRAGSTAATSPSRRPTRARARPSRTTWPRSASG